MYRTLFVCYRHGCRGEYLSHKISMHPMFKTLQAQKIAGRTVIEDEYFNKKFLSHISQINFSELKLPNFNLVVPSHFFYDTLIRHYPNAKCLSIDVPKTNLKAFQEKLFQRYQQYKPRSILELAGECEDKYRMYHRSPSQQEINAFTARVLQKKNVTFGDIQCMAAGMDTSLESKKKLSFIPLELTEKTKKNSFVVPYEEVDTIDLESIINYVKK